jgi:hypothetical protein
MHGEPANQEQGASSSISLWVRVNDRDNGEASQTTSSEKEAFSKTRRCTLSFTGAPLDVERCSLCLRSGNEGS